MLMRRTLTILSIFVSALPLSVRAEALPRVASMHHCMDQYIMELADPDQIVSLSNVSRAPSVSFHAKYAEEHDFPRNRGHAEELLPLQPDVVVAGFYWKDAQDMLRKSGVHVETVYPARSIAEVKKQLRRIAKALHQKDRAEAIIKRIDAEAAQNHLAPDSGPEAVVYYSGGYTQGGGTYFDELLQRSGFRNGAKRRGLNGPGYINLEDMVMLQPDVVLEDHETRKRADRVAATLMDHPALRRAIPGAQRTHLPFELWMCGGEATIAALKFLRQARAEYTESKEMSQ